MKICIILPTYNEKGNVLNIFQKIKKTKIKSDILFIDDNSFDGTRDEIVNLKKKNKQINFIFRKKRLGIGSAHKEGISYCYKKNYDLIITMDADGTHDPMYLKTMIKLSKSFDYIITSRFKKKNLMVGWPFHKLIITFLRYIIIKNFLGLNLDTSGAFRCFLKRKIKLKDINLASSNDYAFFWELTYILFKKKYTIKEIPVKLVYRKLGKSKMNFFHIFNSLIYLFKIKFKKI